MYRDSLKNDFSYLMYGANGIINYLDILIKDDNDVRGIFIIVAKFTIVISIEIYLEMSSRDYIYNAMSIGCKKKKSKK